MKKHVGSLSIAGQRSTGLGQKVKCLAIIGPSRSLWYRFLDPQLKMYRSFTYQPMRDHANHLGKKRVGFSKSRDVLHHPTAVAGAAGDEPTGCAVYQMTRLFDVPLMAQKRSILANRNVR